MKIRNTMQCSKFKAFAALTGLVVFTFGYSPVGAVDNTVTQAFSRDISGQQLAAVGSDGQPLPVTINVIDGSLGNVLDMFALQTGRNVVVGPDVASVSNGVTLHLTNVQWSEALEVILKPYGFGYQKVGDTIVVSRLDKMAAFIAVEPLETKVFTLRFLDASDVQDIIKGQLSGRGTCSVSVARGQKGWNFATSSDNRGSSSSGNSLGKMERRTDKSGNEQVKSKTLIVTDVPGSLDRVSEVIAQVDKLPQQVLVEARFMEVNRNLLRDLGLDFAYVDGNYVVGQLFSGVTPASPSGIFNPIGTAGGDFWKAQLSPQAAFAAKTAGDLQGAIRALQQNEDTKILSAPRVLTMNNQEATIIVGQKFPIIESNVSGGSGNNNTSTTLDYYENVGIQLNVVPQICDNEFINMIVHPSVSAIVDFESGAVSTGSSSNQTALTRYPVIDIRETETQIMLENRKTVVIGGLLQERKSITQSKVPWLGDIPVLGRLFRRDSTDNKTIDLLIFLSATIVNEKNADTIIAEKGVFKNDGNTIVVGDTFAGEPGKEIFAASNVPPAAVSAEAVPGAETAVPAADMSGEDK